MSPPKLPIIITTTPSYNNEQDNTNQQQQPITPTRLITNNNNNNNNLNPLTSPPPPTFSLSTPVEEISPHTSPLLSSSPPELLPIQEDVNNLNNLNNNNSSSTSNNNNNPSLGPYDLNTSPSTPNSNTTPLSYPPPSPSSSYRSVSDNNYQTTTLNLRDNHDPDGRRLAREAEGVTLGLSYSPNTPSDNGYSHQNQNSNEYAHSANSGSSMIKFGEGGMGGNHNRRPSNAVSFTSTIPDNNSSQGGGKNGHLDSPETLVGEKGIKGEQGEGEEEGEKKKKGKFLGIFKRKDEDAPRVITVRPDPSREEMAPFSEDLPPSILYSLIDPKSYEVLEHLGGTEGILRGLKTNKLTGLSDPLHEKDGSGEKGIELEERRRVFGPNRIPERKGKTLLQLAWMAYQDKVLIILSVAAVVSLALGLYQDLGIPAKTYASTKCANNLCTEPQVDWVEGVAITVAIFIVVLVGSINDYQKELQFRKLNAKKEERNVTVLRSSQTRLISVYDIVVGDVCFLEPGEILPVDGIFLSGHNVRCDESGATGESDAVRKLSAEEWKGEGKGVDCFLLSGSKVLEGVGTYVVTGVGESSFNGRIMMSLRTPSETTPLQLKLSALAGLIAKLGSTAGIALFCSLMIRYFVELASDPGRTPDEKAQNFIQILIISVTLVVVAIPEGLPLASTLALAISTSRMSKHNLLVRVLSSCETMAGVTAVCTDKTGTLTQNKMSVVAGSIGVHLKFADHLKETGEARVNVNDDVGIEKAEKEHVEPRVGRLDFSTDMVDINQYLTPALKKLLNDSIAINSTAFEGTDGEGVEGGFVGSKTETALLAFAKAREWDNYKTIRDGAKVVQMIPFSSERKAMGVVVELPGGGYRLLIKGASEVLANMSIRHVVVPENSRASIDGGEEDTDQVLTAEFNDETRANIARTIIFYANQSLRTIALCSRDFANWPPFGANRDENGEIEFSDIARDLTLVAITAIEDPLRVGVAQAVATVQKAGAMVKMVTGDNVLTARSIAIQCGIFSAGGIIMEGPTFRRLTVQERNEVVPRLQVLARSSPEDKRILVEHLKLMGEVVAVTGDGSNDGPALKAAHVGFSMGIAGTEVAKEASDIILMDDNFSSIVSAIMYGRSVNDAVKKFVQFQISVNITAVIVTFVSACASEDEQSVLTAVQLLWVNLIMDTFAALALATDPADPQSLERKPDRKIAPLISVQMWMMIIIQAMYQITIALVLHFLGPRIFNFDYSDTGSIIDQTNELDTLVFNSFVFCQIFNQLNARRLDRGLNIFRGIHKNYYFQIIFLIMVAGQVLIVEVGSAAFQTVHITPANWALSIILGALSLPLAVLVKLIPPAPIQRMMIKYKLFPDPDAPLPFQTTQSEDLHWNEGIEKVIDNLNTFNKIRGGRMRSSSIVLKSREKQMVKHNVQTIGLMAMVPSLVIGAVGGGFKPQDGTLHDPSSEDPSKSSTQLYAGRPLVNSTDRTDGLVTRYNTTPTHSRQPSTASSVGGRHSRNSSLTVPQPADFSLHPPSPSR